MKIKKVITVAMLAMMVSAQAHAGDFFTKNNKVAFRGGLSILTSDRSNEVFTDTLGTFGLNDGKSGFSIATSVDLGMTAPKSLLNTFSLAGEIFMEYSRFSAKTVRQTTSALLAGAANSNVSVSEMNVAVGPKLKLDTLGRFRPWLQPFAVAFLVSSPPSNDSTYLDIGVNFGLGLDVEVLPWLTVGIDGRYTHGFEQNNTNTRYFSTGGSVGINF